MCKPVQRISDFLESYPIATRSSFVAMLTVFGGCFTAPGYPHFVLLAVGAVLAHRRTVTRMILAAGAVGAQHYSCFHRFFSQGCWDMDDIWGQFVQELRTWLSPQTRVLLVADDTLAHCTGIHIFGMGLFYGHPNESCKSAPVSKATNWVVVGIVIPFPGWPKWNLFLPTGCRQFVKREQCRKARRPYRTLSQIAAVLIERTLQGLAGYRIYCAFDGAYANRFTMAVKGCHYVSRLRNNADLYQQLLPPDPHRPGPRPRFIKKDRLPKPSARWSRLRQKPQRIPIPYPTGRQGYLQVKSFIAYWPRATGERPIRVLITRAPNGEENYFFTTDIDLAVETVIGMIAQRWSIEVFFRNSKQHMGLEDPACRNERAVSRTMPFLFFMTGWVQHYFLLQAKEKPSLLQQIRPPWDRRPRPPSFADMLSLVRQELSERLSDNLTPKAKSKVDTQPVVTQPRRAA